MAKLVKMTGSEKPELMTIEWNSEDNPRYAAINTNIIENEDNTYSWDALVLPDFAIKNIHEAEPNTKYKVLLIHILRSYYDDNDATAIMSNYMLDPLNDKYKTEFEQLQACRAFAKNTAKIIIEENIF
jgi:hypothetical protein